MVPERKGGFRGLRAGKSGFDVFTECGISENVECASFVTFSYCDKNYYKNDTVERALASNQPHPCPY